jgi:hypothetical protein
MFRLGCALLELYPRAYRARYGEELRAVLEQSPVTIATLFDLLLGALDAHVRPGRLAPPPSKRARGTVSAALILWIALIVVGSGFAKATEDIPFRAAEAAHSLLGGARIAVEVLAATSAVIVVAAGAPVALSIVRQALEKRSAPLRRAVVIPLLGIAVFVVVTGAVALVARQVHGNGSALGHLAFLLWIGLAVVVAVACALGARAAIERASLHPAALALAVCGAWLLSRVMVGLTIAMALYVVLLTVYASGLQGLANGPLDLPTSLILTGQVAAMVVISALALITARRGLRSPAAR